MIRNYFKIALRNLWKHKAFSIINITGLSIGITACFFIFMYVSFELSYDNFHTKADRIYRLVTDIKTPTETINTGVTAWPFAPNIKNDFPEVESFVRISGSSLLVRHGDIKFQEEKSAFADSTFFKVFDFKLLKGDPKTALSAPASVVFTESTAKKYFGNANPIGQTVLVTGDAVPAIVTGLMKDMPENSQIKADMLVSMSSLTQKFNKGLDNQWGNFGATSYLLLKPGANPKTLEAKFPGFIENHNGKERKASQMFYTFFLEPMTSVYLHSKRDGSGASGSITNVYVFGIVAVFILLIACINFVNLTTARSVERAKEVGIRKVVGAEKGQLARQFIGESVVLCLIAFILTILFSVLLLPLFNQLAGKIISPGIFSNWYYVLILLVTSVVIGLVAGIYPALVLSSFKPVVVLKGRFSGGNKGNLLRKTLVISQFTISIALIIGTIIVYTQMDFMQNRDLGFSKDQMLILDTNGDPAADALKQAIATLPGVKSTANSSSIPGGGNPGAYSEIENKKGDLQIANLDLYFVDYDYVNQFKIKMVAGRAFSREFGTDTAQAMLLNEAAIKMFGYSSPQQAIGRRFRQWGREGKIVGVMKDFHFRSLQENIKPLSMRIELKQLGLISVKVSSQNLTATIAAIENKWKVLIPNRPFSYYFLDEFFDRQYRTEQRFGKLFFNFAVLAILISCLGLLGLASYSTLQRTREIGIRKVLGATVPGIVNMLSKDFLILVVLSFVIATPVSWFFMHKWLQDFAYRIDISWWIFALAGILAIVIALATISFQAIKAAMSNPVKSLRSE
ncbi:ABC transporter permease [Mucilaginibacter sp. SP1R1]|uniref:ABC transporter permease n=1 Tax=Mucilaginibacter sp. SP1R1 TaxID=2723091 RepID=UPI001609FA86|nr:ABC transporter permease [Mucilaginibacter sp. SP1R1]MBB6148781.1 putative ABC transport system permease protein [Mucilaginibacter sp. SP1R1]